MPTAVGQPFEVGKEPSEGSETGRRSGFKLPPPLNTAEDLLDRNVWSPNRRSSSIMANGELRSSLSPRAPPGASLLGAQASGGSGTSSPKTATPTRFEDPLLIMPSFRRSAGSTTLDGSANASAAAGSVAAVAVGLVASPSFRGGLASSNSFSARRSGIDFRRSVPGASSTMTSPGEAPPLRAAAGSRGLQNGLARGNSEFGNSDLSGYASPFRGSESGGTGLDEDDPIDEDSGAMRVGPMPIGQSPLSSGPGAAAMTQGMGRRHSAVAVTANALRSPSSVATRQGGISPAARLHMRGTEEEEAFMQRLNQNRSSWRERPRGGSHGAGGALSGGGGGSPGPYEGGLQHQTHAALQQLRGELKTLSMRSMHGGVTSVALAPPSVDGGPQGLMSVGSAGAAIAVGAAGGAGSGSGAGSSLGLHCLRVFEEPATQLSPSRLAVTHHSSSPGPGPAGIVGAGTGGREASEHFSPSRSPPYRGLEMREHMQAAVAVQAAAEAQARARVHML